MREELDIKLLGVNGSVLATVTLADIQTYLEIALVVVSLAYSLHRYIRFLRNKDDEGKAKK